MVGDIEKVVHHLSETLFHDIDHDIISVAFETKTDMVVDGFCTQEDEFDYTIELRSDLRNEELERTIIHELVHIWQYVRGDLVQEHIDGLGPRMVWMGEDMTSVDYNDRPWEQQAVALEERYYNELISA
jgi:predicted SprT family Zn-dependent metalloprotease